jgi:hypothetical protein
MAGGARSGEKNATLKTHAFHDTFIVMCPQRSG